MTRALGIDLGTKRTGVAISIAGVAQPFIVLDSTKDLVASIVEVVRREEVTDIVIGNPIRLDGSSGPGTVLAEMIADALRTQTGAKVVLWDERMTTVVAERSLLGAGLRRRRRREVVDKVAAAVMLQSYLDSPSAPKGSGQTGPGR